MTTYINDFYNFYYEGEVLTGKLISNEEEFLLQSIDGKEIILPLNTKLFPSAHNQFLYEQLNTFKDSDIEAIISRKELLDTYQKMDKKYHLIYISDPDEEVEQLNYFEKELYVSFYNISSEINGYKPISEKEIKKITDFYYDEESKIIFVCDTGKIKSSTLAYFLTKKEGIVDHERYFIDKSLLDSFTNLTKSKPPLQTPGEIFNKEYDEYIRAKS